MDVDRDRLQRRIEDIVAFLQAAQGQDGEFPTLRRFTGSVGSYVTPTRYPGWYSFGKCPFATANVVLCLEGVGVAGAEEIVRRACSFLWKGAEGGISRYVAPYDQAISFPADIDDTCLALCALRRAGYDLPHNAALLYGNTDWRQHFYTWFVPRLRHLRSPRNCYWLWRDFYKVFRRTLERRDAGVGHILREYWQAIEPGVAANVLLYLGEDAKSRPYVARLAGELEAGVTNAGYYEDPLCALYHAARAFHAGVRGLGRVRERALRTVRERQDAEGRIDNTLKTAMGVLVLVYFEAWDAERLTSAVCQLVEDAMHETGWQPLHYCNDLDGVFQDGGAELTAAVCLEALQRYQSALPSR